MSYTTQMDAARKGIITPQMEIVAKKEQMSIDHLIQLISHRFFSLSPGIE